METLNKIRKEYKAYDKLEVVIDVYCDRVVFGGFNSWMQSFFQRRNVIADCDRGGIAINKKDAVNLGIDLEIGSYIASCDLRKKIRKF